MPYNRAPKCTGADGEELFFFMGGSNFYAAFTHTFNAN